MRMVTNGTGVHAGQPILGTERPANAAGALVMLHGRGGDAADMLSLASALAGAGFWALAPQATASTWYPQRFIAPIALNEPFLSSAVSVVGDLLARLGEAGVPPERTVLAGFSQGACLALEFACRHVGPLGAVIGFSGGLIGETVPSTGYRAPAHYPVFLGCSERDPHIPIGRVVETEAVFQRLGSPVVTRVYPGASHDVNADELDQARAILGQIALAARPGA